MVLSVYLLKRTAALVLLLAGVAQAQEGEAPPADEARLRALEDEVRAERRQIDELLKAAALPAPSTKEAGLRNLAVPHEAVRGDDPSLAAPLAGYSDKNFFLRDRHSWFVLVPKGRVHIDWYNFLNRGDLPKGAITNGPGDPRTSLRDTIFVKRARLGFAGTIARGIDFRLENDFASQAAPGQFGTLADADVVINYTRYIKVEAGQFYAPFTLENVTSENYTDFMEKSAAVRWAVPSARDLGGMLLGELPRAAGRWYFGLFNGDGQNSKNLDNSPAIISRAFIAPLAPLPHRPAWLELLWVGGSIWWQPANNLGGTAAPSTTGAAQGDLLPFTTEGGFTLFSSNYADGSDVKTKQSIRAHLAPDGTVLKYAVELNVPLWTRFGLRGEYVHQSIDVREYLDVNDGTGNLKRTSAPGQKGLVDGWGTYVEAYAWIGGPINSDKPGLYQVPHWSGYTPPPPPRWALQLAVKYEHVEQDITGLPAKDPSLGKLSLDVFELGANLWVTRHARLMANYVLNHLGSGADAAPAFAKNYFSGQNEHELLFRLDVHL